MTEAVGALEELVGGCPSSPAEAACARRADESHVGDRSTMEERMTLFLLELLDQARKGGQSFLAAKDTFTNLSILQVQSIKEGEQAHLQKVSIG